MTASWRGLAVAWAIALVLVGAAAIDAARAPIAQDRALVPGFDPDRATELIWERAGRAIRVTRSGAAWRVHAPGETAPGPRVDASAIADVLATLRGARWHRRGAPTPVHATLTVVAGGAPRTLGVGEPLAGTDQRWIVTGGRAVLVDSWVARALDRDLLALRIKAPLAGVAGARTIAIESQAGPRVDLRITGTPRRLAGDQPLLLAADLAGALHRALAQITIVRDPDTQASARGLAITTGDAGDPDRVHAVIGGGCPGAPELVALSSSDGDGCIESAAAVELERVIARLREPAAAVERRPVPFEPARVVLADGVALDVVRLRLGDGAADQAGVEELVVALATPAEVAAVPATPATGHLEVTGASGSAITLDLFADGVLARHGESIALRPAPGLLHLLVRPSRDLRDPALWLEEATTITAVAIDGVRYRRGAVIGAWTREPAGVGPGARTVDARAVEALVAALAAPRAVRFLDGGVTSAHRVVLTIAPPVGAPRERVLVLGTPRAGACPALVERDAVALPASVCAQIAALAR